MASYLKVTVDDLLLVEVVDAETGLVEVKKSLIFG